MFWRMTGLSTASPVETILDKENFTLEELLDEDEVIQECKALNGRLINFLREKTQVEQLIRYIIEEPTEDAEKKRTFKFPFIACEIFTCEIETILKTLVEDEELMTLLFSFLESKQAHNTQLAGYFSKVVVCLLVRKTDPFMLFVRDHQDILKKMVDLIGITSIMEVLKRLIGTDEHLYTNYAAAMQWIEDTDVLEMIADKFGSSDLAEVHANAAETLCMITRFAPPGLSAKISSPNFIQRLFRHALESTRPKSVLVNSLSVCISLLDPKRFTLGSYHIYNHQLAHGTLVTANSETVEGMLESLGDLLKLLDVSSTEEFLLTSYGKLQPPVGKHRLKIVEFISVMLTVGSEAAEKELIRLGAVKRVLDLFFEYPYNNFLHHHVENVILSCLESKNSQVLYHLLHECDLVEKMLQAEKNSTLTSDTNKPTIPAEGSKPPRIGNIGHLTRISNKLAQMANNNSEIQTHLQGNSEWMDWQTDVLSKRNTTENVYSWACGRPTSLHDRNRDSDEDDYQDRDYDVAALANNLSQAFQYGIYSNDEMDEGQGSLERDDEDVYFDDESAEVVISSLRLGDDQESSSMFTDSKWSAFEDERAGDEQQPVDELPSPSPNPDPTGDSSNDDNTIAEVDNLVDTAASSPPMEEPKPEDSAIDKPSENPTTPPEAADKSPTWVEWRETEDSAGPFKPEETTMALPNGEVSMETVDHVENVEELPEKVEESAEKVEETAEKVDESPKNVEESLEKVEELPEKGEESPEKVGGSPEKVGESPENVEEQHEKVEELEDAGSDPAEPKEGSEKEAAGGEEEEKAVKEKDGDGGKEEEKAVEPGT